MFNIEKNVPVPFKNTPTALYPFRQMEIGDSFFIPLKEGDVMQMLQSRVAATARTVLGPKKISTRCVTENGVKGLRVWRVDR